MLLRPSLKLESSVMWTKVVGSASDLGVLRASESEDQVPDGLEEKSQEEPVKSVLAEGACVMSQDRGDSSTPGHKRYFLHRVLA